MSAINNSNKILVSEKPIYTDYQPINTNEICFIIKQNEDKDKVKFNKKNYTSYIEKNNEHEFIPVIFLNRTLDKPDEDGRGGTELFTVQRLDKNNEEMTFEQNKYYFKVNSKNVNSRNNGLIRKKSKKTKKYSLKNLFKMINPLRAVGQNWHRKSSRSAGNVDH